MTPTIGRELASLHRKIADALDERENLRDYCASRLRESIEATRRAEKAEARVRELEALVAGGAP